MHCCPVQRNFDEARLLKVAKDLAAKEAENDATNRSLVDWKTEVSTLNRSILMKEEQIMTLQSREAALNREVTAHSNEISELETLLAAALESKLELEGQLEVAHAGLDQAHLAQCAYDDELRERTASASALKLKEQEMEAMRIRLTNVEDERVALHRELSTLEYDDVVVRKGVAIGSSVRLYFISSAQLVICSTHDISVEETCCRRPVRIAEYQETTQI